MERHHRMPSSAKWIVKSRGLGVLFEEGAWRSLFGSLSWEELKENPRVLELRAEANSFCHLQPPPHQVFSEQDFPSVSIVEDPL